MFTIEDLAQDALKIDITGQITKANIDQAIQALQARQKSPYKLNVLIDLTAYSGMTMEALLADIKYGLTHFSDLKFYNRIAITSSQQWIATIVGIENAVLRSIDMRHFRPTERAQAIAFVLGKLVDATPAAASIERLESPRDNLLIFKMSGHVTTEDAKAIIARMQLAFHNHDQIDLMAIIDNFSGFDPSILFSSDIMSVKIQAIKKVRRYAIVGAPRAMSGFAEVVGKLMPVQVKAFNKDEKQQALDWLNEASEADAA